MLNMNRELYASAAATNNLALTQQVTVSRTNIHARFTVLFSSLCWIVFLSVSPIAALKPKLKSELHFVVSSAFLPPHNLQLGVPSNHFVWLD
jgi:hypothetical protein